MSNVVKIPVHFELARKFREAATALEARHLTEISLWDVKFFLLAMLNDTDRALHYGEPGAGIDEMLGSKDKPINAEYAR